MSYPETVQNIDLLGHSHLQIAALVFQPSARALHRRRFCPFSPILVLIRYKDNRWKSEWWGRSKDINCEWNHCSTKAVLSWESHVPYEVFSFQKSMQYAVGWRVTAAVSIDLIVVIVCAK